MIYLRLDMKQYTRRFVMLGIGLMVALSSAALTYSIAVQSPAAVNTSTGAAFYFQTTGTPTPQAEDESEIGSTDGIVIMGGVIALIVVIPIFLRRKEWMRNGSQP
jgi:hypothetical protein